MKIGIIADTHDLLRPEVVENLQGAERILHAGDISSPEILERLERIAPVTAVRGNADREWAEGLPTVAETEIGGIRICMAHKKKDLPKEPAGYDLVITGHTHQYAEIWGAGENGRQRLMLNPGSCGPRRLIQPITMAVMEINGEEWHVRRIEIGHGPAPKIDPGDIRGQIETVIRETKKGNTPAEIARKYGMTPETAEQIARLYVTHPGVTADGIMTKMGL